MNSLQLPGENFLRTWFGLISEKQPSLVMPSLFMVLGPNLTEILHLEPPHPSELAEILRLIQDRAPAFRRELRALAEESDGGRRAILELAVDELLASSKDWEHPSQVLDRPRPEYRQLLPVCLGRLEHATNSDRAHVEAVTARVERAARIDEQARRRRQRFQRS